MHYVTKVSVNNFNESLCKSVNCCKPYFIYMYDHYIIYRLRLLFKEYKIYYHHICVFLGLLSMSIATNHPLEVALTVIMSFSLLQQNGTFKLV